MSGLHEVRGAAAQVSSVLRTLFGAGCFLVAGSLAMNAQVSVTTWRNDIARTGQNLNETVLNPSNVNATQFGKLFSQAVDGYVYAEPLYLPNVTIGGQSHNVVFVATEHDSVYAFDADSNGGANANPLWSASMLTSAHGAAAGATTISSNTVGTDIIPELGITGTPVIDPANGTLYVVSFTQEGSSFFLRLHALDITSGAEKLGGPVVITASVPGTGNGSTGGTLSLDPEWANQRAGLLLLNGIIYIAFGSHGDNGPWHGWLLGYNEQTLKQTGAFCTTPNGVGAGIWMGGAGLAADVLDPVNHPYGRIFLATGNGDFTAKTPYAASMDFGDSILNLDLTNGVPTIQDDFTPAGQAQQDLWDMDQASGGLMIVPTQTSGSNPYLLIQTGKTGIVYLLNRQNLGGYNTAGDQVVQELPNGVGNTGAWSTPAYWNGTVYYWGQIDTLKAFPLVNGLLTGPTATSSEKYGYPGANPVVSANGNTQGIVWSLETDGYMSSDPSVLMAHNATNVATTLYSSSTNSSRDNPGLAVKFTVPTVANGKVYVGAQYQLSVYGLLTGQQLASEPVLSPGAETFSGSVSVSITDATAGATIYYTLDGSTPTVASAVYTAPIAVAATTTIQAIASAPGYLQSGATSATYIDSLQVATPTFNPSSSTSTQPILVTISDSTAGASIYYTTNGTTPTTSSTLYTGVVTVSTTETLNAIAVATGFVASDVASATYTIDTGQTGIDFPLGFAGTQGIMILNGSTDLDDSRLQLTTGLTGEAGSAWYYQPINIQAFTSEFSFQLSNPAGEGFTFAIQGDNNTSLGTAGSGLGYQGIANSIAIKFDLDNAAGEGADSTGLYTNGASPTVPAIDLSTTGIDLHSDDTFDVSLTYNGTILSMVISDMITGAAYSTSWTVNIPSTVGGNTAYVGFTGGTSGLTSSQKIETWIYTTVSNGLPVTTSPIFNPPGGAYAASQSVSIASGSSGATIYYTTNGTTPTTASTVYNGPITVNASETLEAIAVASGYGPSAVGTAAYSIAPILPVPVLSPSPATYATAQTVTISDSMGGATIYYTTDGTTPTSSSDIYSSPIAVSASETVQAFAAETGYNNSPVAGGTYTIAAPLPAPTFSLAAGTYSSSQAVTISDATAGATIYYTTNGATPTTSSTVYSGPITVSSTETLEAIAIETGYTNSTIATVAYTISTPGVTYINYPNNGFTASSLSLNNGPKVASGVLQITDGGVGEDRSAWFTTEIPVQSFITNFTFQQSNASADGMTFAIQGDNIWSLGDPGGGLGYQGISKSVAVKFDLYNNSGEGSDSTGLYTGGAIPTVPAVDLSSTAINLHSGDIMDAQLVYDGTNLTMTLTDTVTNGTVTEVFPVNIPSMVGGNTAYVGFTGATGGLTATQNVLSWTYVSPAGNVAASPTFSPAAGTYATSQTVTISDATPGTAIYYTINGTTPTTSSTLYSGPVTVSATETLEAIAVESGYANSAVSTAAYTIAPALASPTFSPAAGTYTTSQSVTLSDATSGTTIYYTTNGTTPTTSSTVYTGPITVSASETLEAIAVETGYTNSTVATAAYTIPSVLPAPTFSPATGIYTTSQSVTISDATSGTTIYYTTNGITPTTSSSVYSGAITVGANETIEALAVETGYTNSAVATATYTINPVMPAPIYSPAAGTYSTSQSVGISDATSGATIYYTTNGTTPTTSSTVYSGPITVSATETLEAIAVETGYTNSSVSNAVYTIASVLPVPTFSPVAGTYTASQSVTISDATSGTAIYYTTNGTTPTTSSTKYAGAITVGATETLEAIAVETGYTNSAVATAVYTINPVLPAPTFSPAAGTYTTSQSVTVSDATSGTTIYYTTNGTTPTTSSSVYSGSITVSATETLEAIAVETGYSNSAVSKAAYTIAPVLPTPTFSPAVGTYTSSQSVTISDATSGTTIYYTTNGTTPTTSSTKYTSAITVTATETLEAIAVETGYTNSAVATAVYTITPVLPAPTFLPAAGTYATSQSVTISDTTSGTTIYYTTNGTTPTTSSTVYGGPITVSAMETLEAIAGETGYTNSAIATAAYTITPALPAPTFSPSAGSYATSQTVTISDATSGAAIYYTTNGTTPTTSSTVYSGPITVSATETLEALAVETGYTNSAVAIAAYTIGAVTTYVNYPSSGFTAGSLSLNNGPKVTGGLLQITDGGVGEDRSAWFASEVPVQAFTTNFTFQQLNASADGMTFAIQGENVWALGDPGGGLGYQGITNSVAVKFDLYNNSGEGSDSTGLYTDGAIPTVPSVDLSSTAINLHSGDIMNAQMVYDGTNLTLTLTDTVTNGTVTEVFPVNIPSIVGGSTAYVGFTGATGGLTATQNVLSWTYSAP